MLCQGPESNKYYLTQLRLPIYHCTPTKSILRYTDKQVTICASWGGHHSLQSFTKVHNNLPKLNKNQNIVYHCARLYCSSSKQNLVSSHYPHCLVLQSFQGGPMWCSWSPEFGCVLWSLSSVCSHTEQQKPYLAQVLWDRVEGCTVPLAEAVVWGQVWVLQRLLRVLLLSWLASSKSCPWKPATLLVLLWERDKNI